MGPNTAVTVGFPSAVPEHLVRLDPHHLRRFAYEVDLHSVHSAHLPRGCEASAAGLPASDYLPSYRGGATSVSLNPYPPGWCPGRWIALLRARNDPCDTANDITECTSGGVARVVGHVSFTVRRGIGPPCVPPEADILTATAPAGQKADAVAFRFAATGTDYACLDRVGISRPLAADDDKYSYVSGIVFNGDWVAFEAVVGDDPYCTYAMSGDPNPICPPPQESVAVLNMRTGSRQVAPSVSPEGLRCTPGGAAVWVSTAAATAPPGGPAPLLIQVLDHVGYRVLDQGNIDAASVKLAGNTLTWTDAGIARSAQLS